MYDAHPWFNILYLAFYNRKYWRHEPAAGYRALALLVPHSLHLCVIAWFGLNLFLHLHNFDPIRAESSCADAILIWIFGYSVPMSSRAIHWIGITIGILGIIPAVNILLVLALNDCLLTILAIPYVVVRFIGNGLGVTAVVSRNRKRVAIWHGVLPTTVPFCVNALIVLTLEGTIRLNREFMRPGEDQWQYGQTLTVGLCAVLLVDATIMLKAVIEARPEEFTEEKRECPTRASYL